MAHERLRRHAISKSEGYRRFNLSQIQTQQELWGEIVFSDCDSPDVYYQASVPSCLDGSRLPL